MKTIFALLAIFAGMQLLGMDRLIPYVAGLLVVAYLVDLLGAVRGRTRGQP